MTLRREFWRVILLPFPTGEGLFWKSACSTDSFELFGIKKTFVGMAEMLLESFKISFIVLNGNSEV